MGLIIILVFLTGFFLAARWSMGQIRQEHIARLPAEAQARARARQEANRQRYGRRAGSPRVHRSAVKRTLPYGVLTFSPVALTPLLAQDPTAVLLMLAGSLALTLTLFLYFNREARGEFNGDQDSETLVSSSVAALDDFTIPDEWNRKYL